MTYMCSVHGKERTAKSLTLDESGSMRCAPGFECHVNGGLKGGLKKSAGAGTVNASCNDRGSQCFADAVGAVEGQGNECRWQG